MKFSQTYHNALRKVRHYFRHTVWISDLDSASKTQRAWHVLLRILTIAFQGLQRNGLFSRAGALSYASLMAIGPVIVIAALISGIFLKTSVELQIKKILLFVSPSLQQYITVSNGEPNGQDAANGNSGNMVSAVDTLIDQIVGGAQQWMEQINLGGSKTFGLMGTIILIWIAIQLLTTIETTLNQIWGVRRGRSWGQRIIAYWAFISLGAILGIGGTALLSAGNVFALFNWIPFDQQLAGVATVLSPLVGYVMLALLLAFFYAAFPNTAVPFRAALLGGLFTATLLLFNNALSFVYIHRVITMQSLFGSLGIIPVLMIGLYFFWLFVLLGGQITFAIQNVRVLNKQNLWSQLSSASQEEVCLAVFLSCSQRYLNKCKPLTAEELAEELSIPLNLVNEGIQTMVDLEWLIPVRRMDSEETEWTAYQPARPLKEATFADFHHSIARHGEDFGNINLKKAGSIIARFGEAIESSQNRNFLDQTIESALIAAGNSKSKNAKPAEI